ncbi:hypothetical protein [Enterococcus avium]|uniref:Uncharacterized protein n=1 Tax=Enterococcus avium TaxID=33945 RepID=A0ABD5F4J5_ENTAV|nr:hypothetical protein [Enterococcus avium]MDT2484110.1 hypothetical protein [Enterococcus avium]MDT2510700.1 hypothetical protein [Enterococcus avium]MDT2513339.1 hypothetical protein [Enterococcus avium]
MKVVSCDAGKTEVSPKMYNACTFEIIDKWDPKQHAKTCDTMFYLRDGTGAYVWDCDQWIFLDFSGYTAPDWNAKENQQGYIKNKPFEKLGEFLEVSSDGVLSVNITPADIGAATKEDLTSHVNDKENPHEVTAGQTGAYTKAESDANVIYQVIGKEKAEITFRLDAKSEFVKVSSVGYTTLLSPTNVSWTPLTEEQLNNLSSLDGSLYSARDVAANYMKQLKYDCDILGFFKSLLGEKFFTIRGATTDSQKVEVLESLITDFTSNVYGYGSGGGINKLTHRNWNGTWTVSDSTAANEVTRIGQIIESTDTNWKKLINGGKISVLSNSEPTISPNYSTVNIDYLCLDVTIELSANEHFEYMIAAYHRENPPEWSDVTEKPFSSINPNQFIAENDILTIKDGILPNPNVFEETYNLNLGQGYISVKQKFGIVQLTLVITDAVYQPNTKIYENGDIDSLMNQLFNTTRLDRINVYDFQNKTAPNIDSYLIEFSNYGIVFVGDSEVTFRDTEMAMLTFTMIPNNEL